MNVAMIKHKKSDKIYWFEVPDRIASVVTPGSLVICDTARGKDFGTVIGSVLDADDVKDIIVTSGARFPLRKIDSINTASPVKVQMELISHPIWHAPHPTTKNLPSVSWRFTALVNLTQMCLLTTRIRLWMDIPHTWLQNSLASIF